MTALGSLGQFLQAMDDALHFCLQRLVGLLQLRYCLLQFFDFYVSLAAAAAGAGGAFRLGHDTGWRGMSKHVLNVPIDVLAVRNTVIVY